uniref:Apple domain-containing protein n=1 Tax=Panagrellus redivivus TaxID=6233 RepID=A0A7E4UV04_PANRE
MCCPAGLGLLTLILFELTVTVKASDVYFTRIATQYLEQYQLAFSGTVLTSTSLENCVEICSNQSNCLAVQYFANGSCIAASKMTEYSGSNQNYNDSPVYLKAIPNVTVSSDFNCITPNFMDLYNLYKKLKDTSDEANQSQSTTPVLIDDTTTQPPAVTTTLQAVIVQTVKSETTAQQDVTQTQKSRTTRKRGPGYGNG